MAADANAEQLPLSTLRHPAYLLNTAKLSKWTIIYFISTFKHPRNYESNSNILL